MALSAGTRLGPYLILAPLGAGGMGEVFRARDTRLDREVALKVLPAEFALDQARRERFEREAKAVAALNHPHIVALHDIGEEDGVMYLVSELVAGHTLRGASLPLRKALDLAAQIAEGLDAAHAAGVTHRDLKPDNIMVTPQGRAKILDFGLAKRSSKSGDDDATKKLGTEPGQVMGTVGYMSPEQVRGEEAGPRSDIFSFGVVLYELLSGQRAFQAATAVETMHTILKSDPPELPASIPEGVRELIGHCLEKSPAQRFQSAKDLGFALRALNGRTVTPTEAVPAVQPAKKRPWAWIGAVALALLVGAAGALRLTSSWDQQPAIRLSRFTSERAAEAFPAFSPDGKSVAYVRGLGTLDTDILVRELTASAPLVLASGVGTNDLFWTPDGTRVCYVDRKKIGGALWCVGAAGGKPQEVLSKLDSARFTPDGKSLLLVRSESGSASLLASTPPGSEPVPVKGVKLETTRSLRDVSPDGSTLFFSGGEGLSVVRYPGGESVGFIPRGDRSVVSYARFPDSRHFAMIEMRPGNEINYGIVLADTQSPARQTVLSDSGAIISLALSPDGRRIMFSTGQPEWSIQEYSMDGKPIRPVPAEGSMSAGAQWIANGERFLYYTGGMGQSYRWWTRAVDGSGTVAVPQLSSPVAVLSPDGKRLAYTNSVANANGIEAIPITGGTPVRVYSSSQRINANFCWSPDSEWIWFREGAALRKVPSQGGGQAVTVKDRLNNFGLVCSPDRSVVYFAGGVAHFISADGKSEREWKLDPLLVTAINSKFADQGRVMYALIGGRQLAVVDVATGTIRSKIDFDLDPADVIRDYAVHPDGKRILLNVGGLRYDLWMAEGFAQPATGWKSWFRHWNAPKE